MNHNDPFALVSSLAQLALSPDSHAEDGCGERWGLLAQYISAFTYETRTLDRFIQYRLALA